MTDIQELFDRDPLQCSDQDILALINEYRKRQGQFKAGTLDAGRAKPRKTKEPTIKVSASELDL